jgi:predicted dehydrogenase
MTPASSSLADASEKYLIVSLGSIGRRHLANLRKLCPYAQIGILRTHTTDRNTAVPAGADYQFFYLDEALAFAPLAAVLAGPASIHLEFALPLAAAGIALLIEKPIAHTTEGLASLLKACARDDVPLLVGYNLRFLPSLAECKRLIDAGAIGRVIGVRAEVGQYLPDWRPGTRYQEGVSSQQALGGGALLELSHEIDYVYWMFGMPARVSARGGRYGKLEINVEDMVELCLEYQEPARLVSIHLDFLQRAPARTCKFIGDKGTLAWNGITDQIDLFSTAEGVWRQIDGPAQPDRNAMYLDELNHFLSCARKQVSPVCDGTQGYDVLAIAEAAKASMAHGAAVPIHGYSGT